MKSKTPKIHIMTGLVASLAVVLAGCNDRGNSSSDTTAAPATAAVDTNGSTANVDNSAKNTRDRNGATLTPGDQGNSDADRQITQKIRQGVVSGTNDYTMTAKNVKIITVDGKVTLRGPVNNDAEKNGIDAIAKNIAGTGNVDDQLEVKASQ